MLLDGVFGVLSFSPDGKYLMYAAEQRADGKGMPYALIGTHNLQSNHNVVKTKEEVICQTSHPPRWAVFVLAEGFGSFAHYE